MARDLSYSKMQRIVLLIDLNSIMYLPDPDPYIAAVVSAAKTLLSFPPLSSSLFSFKLFFSSLSPLLSSSKLSSFSLSFDVPDSTLASLLRALEAIKVSTFGSSSSKSSRGSYVASSMRQIVHDYAWDLVVRDPVIGTVLGCDYNERISLVRSNLVVFFSPVSRDSKWVSEFLGVGIHDECLRDLDLFKLKFRGVFESVNELFVARDIHLSWVDVKCHVGSAEGNDSGFQIGFFESGIKDLGWGFCSTDSIILGSAVVPFGLIYPTIGISPDVLSFDGDCLKFQVQTTLEIFGVNGKPLECKCSELELIYPNVFSRSSKEQPKEFIVEQFHHECMKLHVKAVRLYEDKVKLEGYMYDTFFVREFSEKSDQCQEQESEFYADRVLQSLARETGEPVLRKRVPIWQILLSYLYREGYCALVSLSNGNGHSCTGILRPFTFSSALICIIDNGVFAKNVVHEHSRVKDKGKPGKKNLHLLQDLTWAEFCKVAHDHSKIALEDIYLEKFSSSKKLKFLKCWMKQIKKSCPFTFAANNGSEPCDEIEAETAQRTNNLSQETEFSIPLSASEEDNTLSRNSDAGMEYNDTPVFPSESLESFFSSLPGKIQQGVESEDVDLRALAQRLVNSCMFHLCRKCERENDFESGTTVLKFEDAANSAIVKEKLAKLLLKDPKDLVAVHKKNLLYCKASEMESTEAASENIVREYELQIFFRMEIIGSEIGRSLEASTKHKFVKQICLLLEAIQFHLDDGFFGDWSLDKYVGKIIKSRYHQSLGDVVDKIYTKMDLFLFTEDDEPTTSLLNSEDSNQSGREKKDGDVLEYKAEYLKENEEEQRKTRRRDEEANKLVEAQERRERARRFASFTSWMPDLQRVWVPKQPKSLKAKSVRSRKLSKRKDRDRTSYDMDVVCETPMTANKPFSCSRVDEDGTDHVILSGGPVNKALFQDDL